jgi:hypothetical protein
MTSRGLRNPLSWLKRLRETLYKERTKVPFPFYGPAPRGWSWDLLKV